MKIDFFVLKRALLTYLLLSLDFTLHGEKVDHTHFIYVHLHWKKDLLHIAHQRNNAVFLFFSFFFYPFQPGFGTAARKS
jgi:hypothetical protein